MKVILFWKIKLYLENKNKVIFYNDEGQIMNKTKLSFVIPCFGSENTIIFVVDEIMQWLQDHPDYDYEIIAVNDCSPDGVYNILLDLAKTMPNLKVIELAMNCGKHAAIMAGYKYATGDVIVNLDDDGQCPVDKLELLLAALLDDNDVAMARYPGKKQSAFKNFGSRVNELMSRWLIKQPKGLQISNFSAVRRLVINEILRYKNPYPYLNGLLLRATSRIVNVEMEERDRIAGTGNYTFRKSLSLWLNGFTAFSVKPLRVATFMGMVCAGIGFIFAIYVILRKFIYPDIAAGYSSVMAVLLFTGGIIMICLGLIGEYIGRIYISINNSPQYVIRQTFNVDEKCNAD